MALRSVGDVRCASSSITSMELEMHRTPALLSDLVPDFHFFPDLEPEMGSQRPSDVNIDEFKFQNVKIQIFKLHGPTSILEHQKNIM